MLRFGIDSGRLGNDFINGQRGLNNDLINAYATMSGLDLANRRGSSDIFGNYMGMSNASWNPMLGMATLGANTLGGINDRFMNYSTNAMSQFGNYGKMLTWSPGTSTGGWGALGNSLMSMGQRIGGQGGQGGGLAGLFGGGGSGGNGYLVYGPNGYQFPS
jgi:hypothetical protein